MKALKWFTISVLIFSVWISSSFTTSAAVPPVTYSSPVQVLIQTATGQTSNLVLNGGYQVINQDNGQVTTITPGQTLVFNRTASGLSMIYGRTQFNSVKGFEVQELPGNLSLASFIRATDMRKGATSAYEVVQSIPSGENGTFTQSFTNAQGEEWLNVTVNGKSGWVLKSAVQQFTTTSNPLITVSKNNRQYRGSFTVRPNGQNVEFINKLSMENYLKGVVPSEMPASWHTEALKAQAIAARTYAFKRTGSILSSSTSSQVYQGFTHENARTNAAIEQTNGLLIRYNGQPIEAYFHSTSGGKTANVGDVWRSNQASFPYLVSVDSPDENATRSNWTETFDSATILKSFGYNSSVVLEDVILNRKGANNEVGSVTVVTSAGSKTLGDNENQVRQLFPLDAPFYYLYSSWFDMKVNRSNSGFNVMTPTGTVTVEGLTKYDVRLPSSVSKLTSNSPKVQTNSGVVTLQGETGVTSVELTGKGWGHRIGMSQYGAKAYAEKGWTAEQILKHYYRGTTISK
ncbi:SpoIID/LytB domain-containing protein [Jeotgalibacillus sp. R-1-5s-1]|uniref:SpoIID/LytB domain-containing protein n=1 Tax=Jeotgalibacillus sp. R-1-5s-1 TaxID=2555897 RepID=UPI00106A53F8|nr:SpoIID/LytB domain-containing protein [Jeotgalibacillus sp. R-1-5s-1]TFD95763.1 SpoIID/LytB domain-containing protein [Jeotgalibacillus sp. R-1-5s-1]